MEVRLYLVDIGGLFYINVNEYLVDINIPINLLCCPRTHRKIAIPLYCFLWMLKNLLCRSRFIVHCNGANII